MLHPISRYERDTVDDGTADDAAPIRAIFHIGGLTCASDALQIERRIQNDRGVIAVTVNPIVDYVYVTIDPRQTTPETVRARIEATGYGPVTPVRARP